MPNLINTRLRNVPRGGLVFPSEAARRHGRGNYFAGPGGAMSIPDSHLFPGVVLDGPEGWIAGPRGVFQLSGESLVAIEDLP